MKQRLLVMNGQKIVQNERDGKWTTDKVDKAGVIPPGIYNIHIAAMADKAKKYDGPILHADDMHVFQQVGKTTVKHELKDFARLPEIGNNILIKYQAGLAMAAPSTLSHSRKLSR